MKILLQQFVLINLVLAGLLTSCSQESVRAEYTKDDVKLRKYSWQGEVPRKNKVIVINPHGNITTRNTKQGNIELSGIIQRVGPEAPTPEVKISDNDGITLIEVVYDKPTTDKYANRIGRMDIGVYVPQGVTVDMETTFGDIKAKKHASNLVAASKSGKIKLATKGTIIASSDTGSINVNILPWEGRLFEPAKKKKVYEIHTKEGEIKTYFEADANLAITANSGKSVTSNVPEFQKVIDASVAPQFDTTLGNGQRVLKVFSVYGAIQLDPKGKFQSVLSEPQSFDGDIRNLPKTKEWKPGDPVIEIQDGRSEKNADSSKDKEKDFNRNASRRKKDEGS